MAWRCLNQVLAEDWRGKLRLVLGARPRRLLLMPIVPLACSFQDPNELDATVKLYHWLAIPSSGLSPWVFPRLMEKRVSTPSLLSGTTMATEIWRSRRVYPVISWGKSESEFNWVTASIANAMYPVPGKTVSPPSYIENQHLYLEFRRFGLSTTAIAAYVVWEPGDLETYRVVFEPWQILLPEDISPDRLRIIQSNNPTTKYIVTAMLLSTMHHTVSWLDPVLPLISPLKHFVSNHGL